MNLRPQPILNKKTNLIFGASIFFVTLLVYYLTMARSLSFWDAGEYITCSSVLGVPHPPGNPFYILLGRFASIFAGTIPHAQIVNFLSSIFSAFAVMFTYFFTVKFVTMWLKSPLEFYKAYLIGTIAALYTAFSYTFWNNAIEAEVYAGLAFFINLIVWLTIIWIEKSEDFSHQNILMLMIYLFFLGFGIHQTSLQIAPAVLLIIVYPLLRHSIKTTQFWMRSAIYLVSLILIYLIFLGIGKTNHIPDLPKYMLALGFTGILIFHLRTKISAKTWWFALFFIIVGVSSHIFLYIRAELRPFINEGNPHNFKLFTDYILRRQYGVTSMFVRRASFWFQMKEQFLTYFSWQWFNAETLSSWFKIPQNFILTISNFIVLGLGSLGAFFHLKKNKHSFAYFFSFFFMVSIAMVFVMNLSDAEVRERDYFFVTAYNFWTVWLAIGSFALIDYFSKNKILKFVMITVVIALPIFNFVSQYHIHDRHNEFIALDYGQNILNSVDENAIIFTNGDNDTFPVWYAQAVYDSAATEYIHKNEQQNIFPTKLTNELIDSAMLYKDEQCKGIRKDVTIANLSLLNTPWYIRQLRDHEGVEFNISDYDIEMCQDSPKSRLYPLRLQRDELLGIKGVIEGDEFIVSFKKGTILYVKDLAVIQIIKDNYGKRPIYFAVTTPEVAGFGDFLQNEGMVDRLVSSKGRNQFDFKRLITNIDTVYSYRGVFDDSVYKDKNILRLLNNYGAAFMRTSQYAHSVNDYDNAIKYMEKSFGFIERKQRFYPEISKLYLEASFNFLQQTENNDAFSYLKKAVQYDIHNQEWPQIIFRIAQFSESYDESIALLNTLRSYQDDLVLDEIITQINLLKE
ncbi:MAG: DUF2723 domain-containing protein [Candidatus Cloacimonetes bacterium]|jgi:hypothetical protein|nr:DUF2723 domain-containing protein [Candidatus Cloacimonadota bacterium]MBT6993582.1 DUF2723 domain-containing protein [Candidatus Cloacimonadota bacterium]MBT7470313.1 DUF2723 domain-containing protein [Candidatus Cloacimonadota bacterium]